MKKYINIAFIYAMLGIANGVFYREFTKILGYTERTTLAFTHLHFLVLGTLMFLIIAIFSCVTNLTEQKHFGLFMKLYNIALPLMVVMLYVRGIIQVLGTTLSSGMSAAISGISGIVHVVMTVALVVFFLVLKKSTPNAALKK